MTYQSVDSLQNVLAGTVFTRTKSPKKAAGRALGTLVELITFYLLRDWGLEDSVAIERGLPEFGNRSITHNVEFTLHPWKRLVSGTIPEDGTTLTPSFIRRRHPQLFDKAEEKSSRQLLKGKVIRHACIIAERSDSFDMAYIEGNQYHINRLLNSPFAMFECKRVGVEEGQTKGPQTIEKAKQGSYVARTVSGLQRIPKSDGSVAAVIEESDGKITIHDDYYAYLFDAVRSGDRNLLSNIVLTVGVVSNHGNWFTAGTQNKEIRVLAQSYDWLLFLTDAALSEFIETVLQGNDARFNAVRSAFTESYAYAGGQNTFTKVTTDRDADTQLTRYFANTKPWDRWFEVITPSAEISQLECDLRELKLMFGEEYL